MAFKILVGDVREQLKTLADGSVQCVVTSPPYWALRDYGTGEWKGGKKDCTHKAADQKRERSATSTVTGGAASYRSTRACACGAVRVNDSQLGSEPTPEAFYEAMVGVFREVKRVLRDDGTCWVNMGDSYYSGTGAKGDNDFSGDGAFGRKKSRMGSKAGQKMPKHPVLKPKDLVGQAWGLAIAMRADGWFLRSASIWHKPNPLPESCTDRPSSAHEYMFLFTKKGHYFYDRVAVRTKYAQATLPQLGTKYTGRSTKGSSPGVQDPGSVKRRIIAGMSGNVHPSNGTANKALWLDAGANLRTVWTIPTQAYADAHFATFPEKLVEPCVRAGTSEHGACAKCGAPWERQVKSNATGKGWHDHGNDKEAGAGQKKSAMKMYEILTLGWKPTCECGPKAGVKPCVVLDPFSGSGTTGAVSVWLRREYIGIELNPKYAKMSEAHIAARPKRLARDAKLKPDREAQLRELAEKHADELGTVGRMARLALDLTGGGQVPQYNKGFRGEHLSGTNGVYVNQKGLPHNG